MIKLSLLIAAVNAAASVTCLKNSPTFYGAAGGTAFSDYVQLVQNESADWYYRLTTITLCTDNSGNLNGMQAQVSKYSQTDGDLEAVISTNIVGNLNGLCSELSIDPSAREFVKSLTLNYNSLAIQAVTITSNKN
jgi:hypothetical protein